MKIFNNKRSFRKEFKRQLRMALMAAVGFTIAFAWRNAIFEAFLSYVSRILDVTPEHYLSEIYTALVITLVGVVLIFITAQLLRE